MALTDKLRAIGAAIRAKTGKTDKLTLDEMPTEIEGIQTGGSVDTDEGVVFYDYDGVVLHSYTVEDFKALDELPPLPEHEGLICQGWNYDIETIKSYNGPVNVGATYITDDGKTRLYVSLIEDVIDLPLCLYMSSNGTVVIDWGDGSTAETITSSGNVRINHSYSSVGDYTISIEVPDGSTIGLGNSSGGLGVFASTTSGYHAYGSRVLKKVEIGERTSFNNYSFTSCYNLKSITIPNGITEFGTLNFNGCRSLSSITLPKNMRSIPTSCFQECYDLLSVSIPDGINTIGLTAFSGCKSLLNVVIPKGITEIRNSTFSACSSLMSVTLPEGVLSIGEYAFSSCYRLSRVTMFNGITSIGRYAFTGCNNLQNITIPGSVTSIGEYAFDGCESLRKITMFDGITNIGQNAFKSCIRLDIDIPSSVTSINSSAFKYCNSLTNIVLPEGVTSIADSAFSDCAGLRNVTFLGEVTTIGRYAFYLCRSLVNIVIPDGVTSIGEYAFNSCYLLSRVTMPDGVTNIGNGAFGYCENMKILDFTKCTTIPTLGGTLVFKNISTDCEIRVPAALVDEWKASTNWSTYASNIVGV